MEKRPRKIPRSSQRLDGIARIASEFTGLVNGVGRRISNCTNSCKNIIATELAQQVSRRHVEGVSPTTEEKIEAIEETETEKKEDVNKEDVNVVGTAINRLTSIEDKHVLKAASILAGLVAVASVTYGLCDNFNPGPIAIGAASGLLSMTCGMAAKNSKK